MSSIEITKIISDKHSFAGREWFYNFRQIDKRFSENQCKIVISKSLEKYSMLTKSWDSEKNSEWICRIYFAAKMIWNATLNINSLEYARERNLKVVIPYLGYYSMFSLLRAIIFILPEAEWDDGKLIKMSHNKIINLTISSLSQFDSKFSNELKDKILRYKAYRELISYRSPSQGFKHINLSNDFIEDATLLAEFAQFYSELLEASILKNANESSFEFLEKYIDQLSEFKIHDELFKDEEDLYRLDYLKRKYPLPPNILHIMTEGHVEDFFGGWISDSELTANDYNPDSHWNVIFDIP